MRIPTPAALLIEHPVVPVPEIAGAVREAGNRDATLVRNARLSRRDRFCVALQLTTAVAHLAEFDLWPARGAIQNAGFIRGKRGLSVTMGQFPYPLSVAIERLGGGEGAIDSLRFAALDRIAAVLGLTTGEIAGPAEEPGLGFESAITQQLREVAQPLDRPIARTLWALRWNELPPPENGVVQLWRVPHVDLARRLAGALWCRFQLERKTAWLWSAGEGDTDTAPTPSLDESGALIVAGQISQGDLTALSRWSKREGCSAAAVGVFPRGWPAPEPIIDCERLARHISVVGISPERRRRIIEGRRSRFDPLDKDDRGGLSRAVLKAVSPADRRQNPPFATQADNKLVEWLSLSPRGLPPGFISLHSGMTTSELEDARESPDVGGDADLVRLTETALLEVDARHFLVAGLFEAEDPAHILHMALGNGESGRLEAWARTELDHLNSLLVRDLLSLLKPGALGENVLLLLAEACLSVFDLHGARRALVGVPARNAAPHLRWLRAIDHLPGTYRELPTEEDIELNPRVAAEVATLAFDEFDRRGIQDRGAARELAERALQLLHNEINDRIEIEVSYVLKRRDGDHARWRRHLKSGHPAIRLQLAHRRAMLYLHSGRLRSARRLFEALSRIVVGPGFLGYVELDLGAVALEEGRSREAAGHQLRAYRFLRAAGFEHLTDVALFDLAVSDIDQLRVRQAAERLQRLAATDPRDPFIIGEQARLQLAIGNHPSFREQLAAFEGSVDENDPRFAEGLALLRGVAALFDGDPSGSEAPLQNAGQEGRSWLALASAAQGRPFQDAVEDEWGVMRAAEMLTNFNTNESIEICGWPDIHPEEGLALALAERLAGQRLAVGAEVRTAAIRSLRSHGLTGWAENLSGIREHASGLMTALARIVECGGVEGVEERYFVNLLRGLEITGIEVLNAADGTMAWRYGSGERGSELRQGRLAIIPLGGDLVDGAGSRLVLGLLELVLPSAVTQPDTGAEETGFLGISAAARSLRNELRELGPSHLPVLLKGETGVGKEVAARALHRLSGRHGTFVAVNVAAIPGTLLEAELFGSVKGAYSGADRSRQGLATAADGGTLFLDEVGDLDANLQVKLLRFLESGEVRAVGSNTVRNVDARIVSATHADLEKQMREGVFRRDLYFRIAAPEVHVPPLRDRRDDIFLLRDHFEREASVRHGLPTPTWSPEAEAALRQYNWPGNVRELRQVVEVAMVRTSGNVVRSEHLPISHLESAPAGSWDQAQQDFRRRFVTEALERNNGNRSATARELGISRQALLYHLRKLGMNRPSRS